MKRIPTFYILAVLCLTILVSCENVMEPQSNSPDPSLFLCNIDGSGKECILPVCSQFNLFSPDGQYIYSVFSDSILRIEVGGNCWEHFNFPEIQIGTTDYPRSMDKSGRYLCVVDTKEGSRLVLFDVTTGSVVTMNTLPGRQSSPVFYNHYLFFTYRNPEIPHQKSIHRVDMENLNAPETVIGDSLYTVESLCVSNDGKSFFYCTTSNRVMKYDPLTQKEISIFQDSKFGATYYNRLTSLKGCDYLVFSNERLPGAFIIDYHGEVIDELDTAVHLSVSDNWRLFTKKSTNNAKVIIIR